MPLSISSSSWFWMTRGQAAQSRSVLDLSVWDAVWGQLAAQHRGSQRQQQEGGGQIGQQIDHACRH
jgi:hypothetical protein